jgi:uncharacterized membrane protein YfcA
MIELPLQLGIALGFFLIAALYSSVGFAGGSSYLAILSLVLTNFFEIKTIALICNLVVAGSASYFFIKEKYFDKKKFIPLALCSVPAAFLGAAINLSQKAFFISLGLVLALSGILLFLQVFRKKAEQATYPETFSPLFNITLGGGTGFLAGLVGIGGGILISPILNLFNLEHPKKIAALASFIILVNSIAGLLGQVATNTFTVDLPLLLILVLAVFLGGLFGTRISFKILLPAMVKGLTGVLVSYIGLKLILKHSLSIDI